MTKQLFSVRLDEDVVNLIKERYPNFGKPRDHSGATSAALLALIGNGLGNDPLQQSAEGIAELKAQVRDLDATLNFLRKNLSVVLELVLRNTSGSEEEASEIVEQLRQKGILV